MIDKNLHLLQFMVQ